MDQDAAVSSCLLRRHMALGSGLGGVSRSRGWQCWRRIYNLLIGNTLPVPPSPSLTSCPHQTGGRPLLWEATCFSSWKAERDCVKETRVNLPGTLSAMSYSCVPACVRPLKLRPKT